MATRKTSAQPSETASPAKRYFIVNPAGAIHEVSSRERPRRACARSAIVWPPSRRSPSWTPLVATSAPARPTLRTLVCRPRCRAGANAMSEPTYLTNGRFLHDLGRMVNNEATYAAGDGDEHYGVACSGAGGGSIAQSFAVQGARAYTVHLSVKAVSSPLSSTQAQLIITDGAGNTIVTQTLTGTADTWTEQTFTLGLAKGTTYQIKLINNSAAGNVKIDDVWLWWVPMTRAAIATRVHTKLARLATRSQLSLPPQQAP